MSDPTLNSTAPVQETSRHDLAVFLDRDGVIIEDTHLITTVSQVRLIEGVDEAMFTSDKVIIFGEDPWNNPELFRRIGRYQSVICDTFKTGG